MSDIKHHLYFDLETAPSTSSLVRELLALDIKPPGSMSKPDTIRQWEIDKKPELVEEAVKKTALDGALGSIAVIGVAFGDDDPETFYAPGATDPSKHEANILRAFFSHLDRMVAEHYRKPPVWVGHFISGFDLRFLYQRCVVLGIKPPSYIPFNAKPWDGDLFDTMVRWAGVRDTIKMDKLAKALGLPGKQGLDGSQVAEYIAAGRIAEVADYCANVDVRQVREIHRKMCFIDCDRPIPEF